MAPRRYATACSGATPFGEGPVGSLLGNDEPQNSSPFRLRKKVLRQEHKLDSMRPVVRGPRITVQTVLEFLAAGDSVEHVLKEYPKLTRAHVQACLGYAMGAKGSGPES